MKRPENEAEPLPKSDRADELEELSDRALRSVLLVDRFRLRSEPGKDRGNDRYLELKSEGRDTNCRAQIQLKAAESWKQNRDGSVSLSVKTSNFNYLLNGTSPIYILWNSENEELRYAWARDECRRIELTNADWRNQSSITLRFERVLDEKGFDDIHNRVHFEAELQRCLHEHSRSSRDSEQFLESLSKLQNAVEERRRYSLYASTSAQQLAILKAAMLVGGSVTSGTAEFLDVSPEQVAEIVAILRGETRKRRKPKTPRPTSSTAVLPEDRLRTLGIIGVCPIPFSAAELKAFFPEIEWNSELRYLRRRHLIQSLDGKYRVPVRIKRSFISTDESKIPYQQEWIDALEPLREHPDTALFLGVMQVSAGRFVESVCTLVDMAEACFPGHWNDTYLSILLTFDDPGLLGRITNDQRSRYFNSVALCLSRAGRHAEAVDWFLRMRRFAKRVRNNWGISRSYHNCGIAYVEMGNQSQAASCFRAAIKHTRKTRDRFLLGRSLYELAMTTANTSVSEAAKLLSESEKVKKQVGDDAGMLGVNHGHAVLAVQRGDYREALRWFKKAEKTARRVGNYHAQALERFNIGKAHSDLKEYEQALPHMRQAKKMAEEDGLPDVLVLAVGGEALALERQGKSVLSEKAFRRLFELHLERGDDVDAVIALHDVGALLMRQKKYKEARTVLAKAAQLARRKNVLDWAYQSQADIATCHVAEQHVSKAIATLRRLAANEDSRGLHEVAARLWSDAISYSIENDVSDAIIAKDFERCMESADKASDSAALKIPVYAHLHLWRWKTQDYAGAMGAIEEMMGCARSSDDDEMEFRAQDQIGVCLQELHQFHEAAKAHRRALKIARRLNDPETVETSLNNLGEALRKTGRYADSIRVLEEAEESARKRADHESVIGIAHNRALALEDQERFEAAEGVFVECRDDARRRRLWGEYVRALHALANIAWHRGDPEVAERRYARALQAAEEHAVIKYRHEICLNYANALRWQGHSERALEVLGSATSEFESIPDAHRYHAELATLYEEAGNTKAAAKHWQLSHLSAKRVSDDYALALSAGALAEIHDDAGQLETADQHYQSALEHETDAGLRMTLLRERMGILLQLKKEKEASAVFNELQRLAAEQESQDDYLDALIMMGDYNWIEGDSPKEALRAYFGAMATSAGADIERYYEIGGMIAVRLSRIQASDKTRRIAALQRSVVRWLEREQGIDLEKENGDLLLWPFLVSKRLVKITKPNRDPDEDEFVAIVEDEINKALAK